MTGNTFLDLRIGTATTPYSYRMLGVGFFLVIIAS
jgi:hypothetical protein